MDAEYFRGRSDARGGGWNSVSVPGRGVRLAKLSRIRKLPFEKLFPCDRVGPNDFRFPFVANLEPAECPSWPAQPGFPGHFCATDARRRRRDFRSPTRKDAGEIAARGEAF